MTDQSVNLIELKRLAEILANRPTEGQVNDGAQVRETVEAYVVSTKPQVILSILAQLAAAAERERVLVTALENIKGYWNGLTNKRAMSDACHTHIALAEDALHKVGALECRFCHNGLVDIGSPGDPEPGPCPVCSQGGIV